MEAFNSQRFANKKFSDQQKPTSAEESLGHLGNGEKDKSRSLMDNAEKSKSDDSETNAIEYSANNSSDKDFKDQVKILIS